MMAALPCVRAADVLSIRDALATRAPAQPIRNVIRAASAISGIPESELLDDNRAAHLSWVRFAIMAACQRYASYSAIGRVMGRDHSTIIHGVKRALTLGKSDPAFATFVSMLEAANG